MSVARDARELFPVRSAPTAALEPQVEQLTGDGTLAPPDRFLAVFDWLAVLERVEDIQRVDVLLGLLDLAVVGRLYAEAARDGVQEGHELSHLVLGQQTDLQVQLGAFLGLSLHAVLGDQYERGQEDRFHRCHHRQNHKAGIEHMQTWDPAQVPQDPDAKYGGMNIDELQAAGEARDPVRDAILRALATVLGAPTFEQSVDITSEHAAEAAIVGIRQGAVMVEAGAVPGGPVRTSRVTNVVSLSSPLRFATNTARIGTTGHPGHGGCICRAKPISRELEALLQPVETAPVRLAAYDEHAEPTLLAHIRSMGASLGALRVVHINATADGGGVAEILRSLVPLLQDVGVDARWYVLPPDDGFFSVTKQVHNWLQGAPGEIGPSDKRTYSAYLQRLAAQMADLDADVWVVHDPQPLALRSLVPLEGAAIWRCHIDCSTPNGHVRQYLTPWIRTYDRALFSMPEYVLPGLATEQVRLVYPAIDPLTPKNSPLSMHGAQTILAGLGVDTRRPLVTQVSRFDPWKNPWQVVDAYRLAKRAIPEMQLALVGTFAADDDPEAPEIYKAIREYAGDDPDVYLFTDPTQVGPRQVNAFQSASDVILQRSTREGFGLTVTEAMWKARPVVATPVGGITVQIQHGQNGFLVESTEGCAEYIVRLLTDDRLAKDIGAAARRSVQKRFLLPRLVSDHLQLYQELVGKDTKADVAA